MRFGVNRFNDITQITKYIWEKDKQKGSFKGTRKALGDSLRLFL